MKRLVLDTSVTMTWCFTDQRTAYSTEVLEVLVDGCLVVPALWFLEVANVAALAEQKGILRAEERKRFLKLLGGLRKQVDPEEQDVVWGDAYDLAVRHGLTSYDARYIELARRTNLPLATEDRRLLAAAKKAGIARFAPDSGRAKHG